MARVTSKRQVTIPKTIAERYGIQPGDSIEFVGQGNAIRVQRSDARQQSTGREQRLRRFDLATERQLARQRGEASSAPAHRDWLRDDLYERGRAR